MLNSYTEPFMNHHTDPYTDPVSDRGLWPRMKDAQVGLAAYLMENGEFIEAAEVCWETLTLTLTLTPTLTVTVSLSLSLFWRYMRSCRRVTLSMSPMERNSDSRCHRTHL